MFDLISQLSLADCFAIGFPFVILCAALLATRDALLLPDPLDDAREQRGARREPTKN